MRRTILEPANTSGKALTDLKGWLGINRPNEDELLTGLLDTALAICESFTGQTPLSQLVEERLDPRAGRSVLLSQPIAALVTAEIVAQDGSRTPLDSGDFEFALDASGCGSFNLFADADGQAIAVRVQAGLSTVWEDLPAPLRQGMIRLSAFQYRDRDRPGGSKSAALPPASVSALWHPWRAMRIA